MHLMPTMEDPDSPQAVLARAQRVQTTPLYRAKPQSAQASVDMCIEILADLAAWLSPKGVAEIIQDGSAFMQRFCGRSCSH